MRLEGTVGVRVAGQYGRMVDTWAGMLLLVRSFQEGDRDACCTISSFVRWTNWVVFHCYMAELELVSRSSDQLAVDLQLM